MPRHPRHRFVPLLALGLLTQAGCGKKGGTLARILPAALPLVGGLMGLAGGTAGSRATGKPSYTPFGAAPRAPGSQPSSLGPPRNTRGGGLPLSEDGTVPQSLQGQAFRVKASTFGNQKTAKASQDNPDNHLSQGERCVALPADAIGRWVRISKGGNQVYAPVCDKGPWKTDDPYWQTGQRPWAERNVGKQMCGGLDNGQRSCNIRVNGAAIDLSWQTWADLTGTSEAAAKNQGGTVEWLFADRAQGLAWLRQKGELRIAWFPTRPRPWGERRA